MEIKCTRVTVLPEGPLWNTEIFLPYTYKCTYLPELMMGNRMMIEVRMMRVDIMGVLRRIIHCNHVLERMRSFTWWESVKNCQCYPPIGLS